MIFPMEETKELFLTVLAEIPGARIIMAAEMAQVHPQTIYKWIRDNEEFAQKVEEIQIIAKESRLDKAEDVIDYELESGDHSFPAAKYVLDNQGQSRGFGKGRQINILTNIGLMGNYPDDPQTPEEWSNVTEMEKVKQLENGENDDG